MRAIFAQSFLVIGVSTDACADASRAAEQVSAGKFKAVVLDLDCIADQTAVIEALRKNQANRNAVLLAVASDESAKARAFK